MKRELLAILACPRCRGDLTLVESRQERGSRIVSGTLQCVSCSQSYPVESGIPRLVQAEDSVQETGRRFNFQWVSRWQGSFEQPDRCHGFDHQEYVKWMVARLGEHGPLKPGDRILDAGCGSGEKTSVMARLCPRQQVIGLDLGIGALEKAAAQYGEIDNLHYVQGNILQPPFKWGTFRWGISIGMLHHTPDTRRAFSQFRKLLLADATLLIWLYRPFWEAPEWRPLYFVRDVLFLGQSPRLPPRLLQMSALLLVAAFFPLGQFAWWRHGRRLSKHLPFFDIRNMTVRERFDAQVFHLFDTLLPRYQFRHKRREIEAWFAEEGLEMPFHAHGYYLATTPQRRSKRIPA
jgi:uncharacterized protein YbaR (Trm112 family)